MKVKHKIIQTLFEVADQLRSIQSEWYLIGASSMVLSDIEIENTSDIDILTMAIGSDEIQNVLRKYIEKAPITKENDLFRSNFARFNLPLMDIEVMGNLQVKRNGVWDNIWINHYFEKQIGNLNVKLPTANEQIRILKLFGREKDLKRIPLFEQ